MKITMRGARGNVGLTQRQVAEIVGVNKVTVAKWEKGTSIPNIFQMEKLCEVYGLSYDDIFFTKK